MIRASALSLVLHAGAVLWLFMLPVSPPIPSPRARPVHVTLIAPPPAVRVRSKPKPARLAPLRFSPPRPVVSLPRPAAPRISLDLPAAATVSAPPALPTFQLPGTPAAPPPKTDNLSEVRPVRPPAPPKIAIRTTEFSSVETSPREVSRKPRATTGAFDSAGAAERTPSPPPDTHTGGFSDAAVAVAAPAARKSAAAAGFTPVEIISKPRPVYTDEARRLQIEGEVLLEIMFGASGEARLLRIVHGLGHGLDETAVAAARAIRFHPAQREGAPVDSAAVVHIIFQLAY